MILEKCPSTLGLTDDVIVYGKTKEEHDRNRHNLMKISHVEGLTFNNEKCIIDQKQIYFFGAICDKNGVRPDPKKAEKIKMLPSLKSITDLQRVLGINTYMTPFVLDLSDLTSPVRDLLKKNWSAG